MTFCSTAERHLRLGHCLGGGGKIRAQFEGSAEAHARSAPEVPGPRGRCLRERFSRVV